MFCGLIVVKRNEMCALNLLGIGRDRGRGHLKVTTHNLAGAGGARLSTWRTVCFLSRSVLSL